MRHIGPFIMSTGSLCWHLSHSGNLHSIFVPRSDEVLKLFHQVVYPTIRHTYLWYCTQLFIWYIMTSLKIWYFGVIRNLKILVMYIFTIHCWLLVWLVMALHIDIDGLVQDCSNSSALGMELLQSWAKVSIWPNHTTDQHCACRWFSTNSHRAISRYSAGYKVSIFYLAFNDVDDVPIDHNQIFRSLCY